MITSTGKFLVCRNLLVLLCLASPCALAQAVPAVSAAALSTSALLPAPQSITVDQIVGRIMQHNREQARTLLSYTEKRHYSVVYHGFPALRASMTVEAVYDAPSTKHFVILSQSGSGLLISHVLRRLLQSEQEAARDPHQADLSPTNYSFTLLGQQLVSGHPAWVLHADPKGNAKFLFRGNICVDPQDYAVIRIDAEPAKNPSFWIRRTQIHHVYAKTGAFWLPEENTSETSVRLGGTAILTIDYGTPQIGVDTRAILASLAQKPGVQPLASR